jgi:hypothetical protein
MLTIWNDTDFIRHVGDRGIRTPTEARQAMRDGVLKLYTDLGCGPYLVESLDGRSLMGICGLFKRDNLDYPDIGYSLLAEFRAPKVCCGCRARTWRSTASCSIMQLEAELSGLFHRTSAVYL